MSSKEAQQRWLEYLAMHGSSKMRTSAIQALSQENNRTSSLAPSSEPNQEASTLPRDCAEQGKNEELRRHRLSKDQCDGGLSDDDIFRIIKDLHNKGQP